MSTKEIAFESGKEIKGRSLLQDAIHRLLRNKLAVIAFIIIVIYLLLAIFSALNLFHIKEAAMAYNLDNRYFPIFKSWAHPFGTDTFGRDVLARAIYGTKISLMLGLLTVVILVALAIFFGSIAGYYGGIVDELVVWLMATVQSIPGLLLIMALILVLGTSFVNIAFALAVSSWIGLARIIRGTFLQAKEFEYVLAARSLGASDFRIIFKYILPNVFHFVIINSVLAFVSVVKTEVILAYLGLTVVGVPTWGIMISDSAQELIANHWQNLLGAAILMFFFILSLNIFGDALRDALDPKLRNL